MSPKTTDLVDIDFNEYISKTESVTFVKGSDIIPEPINWLWNGWLAKGKIHIFAGSAGTGKTTIAIALAATVTTGGRFPDGSTSPIGNVLIWSGEDDPNDTLVPRLMANKANMDKVFFIKDTAEGIEKRSFDPSQDMTNLEDSVWKVPDVALLIIDPIVSAINGNGHNNVDVRKSLQPIVDFGQKVNCAILGITHFSKGTETRNPLERVTGSLAFGAVARVVIATAKIQVGDDIKRIVCRAKSNISEDSGGYEYEIRQERITNDIESSCVIWGPAVEGQAIDLLAQPINKDRSDETALDSAKNFLKELLSDGSLPSKQIFSDAKEAGFSSSTLNRAKTELQIKARKSGVDNCWYWELQDIQPIQDTQPNKMSILTKLPIQESSQNSLRI